MNHEEITAALAKQREAVCRILTELDAHRNMGIEINDEIVFEAVAAIGHGVTTIGDVLEEARQ
jgi:hypothetical protein